MPGMFSLGFEDEYEELEADLQEFSEKFADSPAAQVVYSYCSVSVSFLVQFQSVFLFFVSIVCLHVVFAPKACFFFYWP